MSDSDDTDVLLLIPPDYFFHEDYESVSAHRPTCLEKLEEPHLMSKRFDFPPEFQQTELQAINERLFQIEKQFSPESELSSVSNCTVRTTSTYDRWGRSKIGESGRSSPLKNFIHSTPKFTESSKIELEGGGVLQEIDQFLNSKPCPSLNVNKNNLFDEASGSLSTYRVSDGYTMWCKSDTVCPGRENNLKASKPQLLSLQELWGDLRNSESGSPEEERLRRQHCEKTIQALQTKLLEYQQKISVALHVDRKKDSVIGKLNEENTGQKNVTRELEAKLAELEKENEVLKLKSQTEQKDLKSKNSHLEKELAQALDLAATFQKKNQALEGKVEELNKAYSEVEYIYKKQIENLELKLDAYQRDKEAEGAELNRIKTDLEKYQNDVQAIKAKKQHLEKQSEILQGEIELLKQQKQNTYDKFKEERERAGHLDKQNKELRQCIQEFAEIEKNLKKELELQRSSLKIHYQKQLEEVVSQKVKEFQSQLDHVEESLKTKSKERESLIAQRAIDQLELINDKSEQEIKLLNEKHCEEVEFYKIQLVNASKKIDELDEKLNSYRSRRADIAEKLHSVMETQWQKALEILTSPSANMTESFQSLNPENMDRNKLDGLQNQKCKQQPENESFDTPTSSRHKKQENSRTKDRLHAFIELLLSKSPQDIDTLETLSVCKALQLEKCEKSRQKHEPGGKPPWK